MFKVVQWVWRIGSHIASMKQCGGLSPIRRCAALDSRRQELWAARQNPRHLCIMLAVSCLLLPLSTIGASAQSAATPNSPPPDKAAALQQAIHDYILAHPEVLIESLQRAKAKAEADQIALVKSKIMAVRKYLVDDPGAPVLGNPKGDVTLVEFFDYRCPFCRQVEPWLQTLIKQDPGVRVVEKEFPILGPASVYAAHVALAAWKQGKHTAFRHELMAKEGKIDERDIHEDLILQAAKSAGLDIDRMNVDLKSSDVEAEISGNMRIANSLGLTGTPAFIIGTELVPGATDLATLHAMVDDARRGLN